MSQPLQDQWTEFASIALPHIDCTPEDHARYKSMRDAFFAGASTAYGYLLQTTPHKSKAAFAERVQVLREEIEYFVASKSPE